MSQLAYFCIREAYLFWVVISLSFSIFSLTKGATPSPHCTSTSSNRGEAFRAHVHNISPGRPKVSSRHPNQMPKPLKFAPSNEEEQWLYSELPPGDWVLQLFSRVRSSSGHYPQFMSKGEGSLLAQLTFHHNGQVQLLSAYQSSDFLYPHFWTRLRDIWTSALEALPSEHKVGILPFSQWGFSSQLCNLPQ